MVTKTSLKSIKIRPFGVRGPVLMNFEGFARRLKFDGFLRGQKTVEKHEKLKFRSLGGPPDGVLNKN